jgi:hypothetical protein
MFSLHIDGVLCQNHSVFLFDKGAIRTLLCKIRDFIIATNRV